MTYKLSDVTIHFVELRKLCWNFVNCPLVSCNWVSLKMYYLQVYKVVLALLIECLFLNYIKIQMFNEIKILICKPKYQLI